MENWVGVGLWIILGAAVGLAMKILIKLPATDRGHDVLLAVLGAFGAVIGGMLGVGILSFRDPVALSPGGFLGALLFSAFSAAVYRWGAKRFI